MKKLAIFSIILAVSFVIKADASPPAGELLYAVEERAVKLQSPFPQAKIPKVIESEVILSDSSNVTEKSVNLREMPCLCAVMGSGENFLAVIEQSGQSGLYRLGDVVGDYTVSQINNDEVELTGSGVVCRLRIGQ